MQELPLQSKADFRDGIWFVFPLHEHIVRGWGSRSGLERVYVDDRVVSEHRSFGRTSVHAFTVGTERCELRFVTQSYFKGPLECTLSCAGKPVAAFCARYSSPPFSVTHLALALVLGGFTGWAVSYLKWPPWTVWPALGLVLLVLQRTRKRVTILIEEINPTPGPHGDAGPRDAPTQP